MKVENLARKVKLYQKMGILDFYEPTTIYSDGFLNLITSHIKVKSNVKYLKL